MSSSAAALLDDVADDEPRPLLRPVADLHATPESEPGSSSQPHGVILVIDDDEALRRTIVEILRLHGHDVLEAANGEVALEMLRSQPVDILILDLAMPKVDGLSVLAQLADPAPQVIVCSAFEYYSVDQLQQPGLRSKVFKMLRKPVPPPALLSAVEDALRAEGP